MASRRPGAYGGSVKFPTPKKFYVLSQVADRETGDLSWCIVDNAGDVDSAEQSRQQREDYIAGRDAAETKAAEQQGREPDLRHSLFMVFSLDELITSGLGHLIGRG